MCVLKAILFNEIDVCVSWKCNTSFEWNHKKGKICNQGCDKRDFTLGI